MTASQATLILKASIEGDPNMAPILPAILSGKVRVSPKHHFQRLGPCGRKLALETLKTVRRNGWDLASKFE